MRRTFLLAWRLHRAELLAVALASVAVAAWAVLVAREFDGIVAGCRAAEVVVAPCGGLQAGGTIYDNDLQGAAGMIHTLAAALPFAAAVALGVPIVSREIEGRTAHLAWPLARSRVRWLAGRALPLALLGVALLALPAMAGEVLERAMRPLIDPGASFESYGVRGPLLVARFLPAFALAVAAGTVVGRQLPALLVAGLLAGGIGVGSTQLAPYLAEAVEVDRGRMDVFSTGDRFVRLAYRDADGNWMPQEAAWELLGTVPEGEEIDAMSLPEEVFFVIPGERYADVIARESAILLAAAAGFAGAAVAIVRRRRPG